MDDLLREYALKQTREREHRLLFNFLQPTIGTLTEQSNQLKVISIMTDNQEVTECVVHLERIIERLEKEKAVLRKQLEK